MTTDQLSAFLTLAQEKRFVSAARRLGMSPVSYTHLTLPTN